MKTFKLDKKNDEENRIKTSIRSFKRCVELDEKTFLLQKKKSKKGESLKGNFKAAEVIGDCFSEVIPNWLKITWNQYAN